MDARLDVLAHPVSAKFLKYIISADHALLGERRQAPWRGRARRPAGDYEPGQFG